MGTTCAVPGFKWATVVYDMSTLRHGVIRKARPEKALGVCGDVVLKTIEKQQENTE